MEVDKFQTSIYNYTTIILRIDFMSSNRSRTDTKKPVSDRKEVTKTRSCLMCGKTFVSGHFGERVCPTCKGTSAWREGDWAA